MSELAGPAVLWIPWEQMNCFFQIEAMGTKVSPGSAKESHVGSNSLAFPPRITLVDRASGLVVHVTPCPAPIPIPKNACRFLLKECLLNSLHARIGCVDHLSRTVHILRKWQEPPRRLFVYQLGNGRLILPNPCCLAEAL